MQGVQFGSTTQNWYYEGAMVNFLSGSVIGDSLAGQLFENAYLQRISLYNDETGIEYFHSINAVVVDPMNNGNSAYFTLEDLQESLNRNNYINLILIDYSALIEENNNINDFKSNLDSFIQSNLGENFTSTDLTPIFNSNTNQIKSYMYISLTLSFIMAILIIFIIYQYQNSRIQEDQKDLIIIRSLGGSKNIIRNTIFLEQSGMIMLGFVLSIIGTMILVMFFLLENIHLPSIWFPIGILIGAIVLFSAITFMMSHLIVKNYKKELISCHL